MIREAIEKIVNKEDLTYEEAYAVMNEIMDGTTTPHSWQHCPPKAREPKQRKKSPGVPLPCGNTPRR